MREAFDAGERPRQAAARLHGQPFVDDERLTLPARVEVSQRPIALLARGVGEHRERGELIGHIVRRVKLLARQRPVFGRIELVQVAEAEIAQAPPRSAQIVRLIRRRRRQCVIETQ